MIIEITDSSLIEKTGGIIQGMSGSPIIQDGMLIGAVTHVFVNDPIRGYAVFADNMLKVSEALNAERLLEKAIVKGTGRYLPFRYFNNGMILRKKITAVFYCTFSVVVAIIELI